VVVAGLPLDVDYDGFHLQGWQIFACPFHDQPVNWASVCADENNRSLALGETIYGWPGVDGNYMALDEIEPGTSAFIYVGAAAGGHLHIPIGGQALSVRNASSWRPDPFGPDQPPPPLPPGAHIHIDFPNGGERFVKGQSFLVEWTSSGIQPPNFLSYIVLEISTDGGRSYRRIRPPFPNTGRYPWRIPPGVPASTQCLLRATSTLYPEVSDTSDAAFAVVNNVQ
jgi:hypothetical protein